MYSQRSYTSFIWRHWLFPLFYMMVETTSHNCYWPSVVIFIVYHCIFCWESELKLTVYIHFLHSFLSIHYCWVHLLYSFYLLSKLRGIMFHIHITNIRGDSLVFSSFCALFSSWFVLGRFFWLHVLICDNTDLSDFFHFVICLFLSRVSPGFTVSSVWFSRGVLGLL